MRLSVVALTLSCQALVGTAVSAQPFNDETLEVWRDRVLPVAEDLAWRQIPWRPSLGAAVLEADAAGRPVLLWAMNGHPLGCV